MNIDQRRGGIGTRLKIHLLLLVKSSFLGDGGGGSCRDVGGLEPLQCPPPNPWILIFSNALIMLSTKYLLDNGLAGG